MCREFGGLISKLTVSKKGIFACSLDSITPLTLARSSLAKHHKARLPHPSSIIASSFTSPIDSLYLAAIFDPIFTASYPTTRLVHQISLLQAMLLAFKPPLLAPPSSRGLTDLETLLRRHHNRPIVVFPECSTTNGRGILPFSPSLLTVPSTSKIFPISLRYTPADITTPIPRSYFSFMWNLLTKPTHCIRVRIAENVTRAGLAGHKSPHATKFLGHIHDDATSSSETLLGSEEGESLSVGEKQTIDAVAEALARMGRVKRVGLSLKDKAGFIKAWTRHRR